MARRHCPPQNLAQTFWGWTLPHTWWLPATSAPRTWVSRTADFKKAMPLICRDLQDQSFDLVVSIFGAMFAPRPRDVAREKVRVTRRGGRILMGNWIHND